MSFEVFKNKIGNLISKAAPETRVFYSYDKQSGKYYWVYLRFFRTIYTL